MSSPANSEEREKIDSEKTSSPMKPDSEEDDQTKPDSEEDDQMKPDEADHSDEDNSDELGLLDRPVEVSGSRERKKVQRLEISFSVPSKEKQGIPEGSGDKLGDFPTIEQQLQKTGVKDLKILHKILFGRLGSFGEIKKNIRKFSGFTFAKDSPEYEKKKAILEKMNSVDLKHVCEVLDLERGGTKEDLVNRILDFSLHPKISEKKTTKKRTKGVKRRRSAEKKSSTTASKMKKHTSEDENSETGETDEKSDEEEKQKVDKKKTKTKKKESVNTGKKAAAKKKASSSDSLSDSDDDTPLVKIAKVPPTDGDIKALIKKILKSADLQEITMKKVIKQVYDAYPDFDLSKKKDFIKATVKSEENKKYMKEKAKKKSEDIASSDVESDIDVLPLSIFEETLQTESDIRNCIKLIMKSTDFQEKVMENVLKKVNDHLGSSVLLKNSSDKCKVDNEFLLRKFGITQDVRIMIKKLDKEDVEKLKEPMKERCVDCNEDE